MPNVSVKMRDDALTKRNRELRYLRRLVGQLKNRIRELESRPTQRAVGGAKVYGNNVASCTNAPYVRAILVKIESPRN